MIDVRSWWRGVVRRAFLRTLHDELPERARRVETGCDYSHMAVDLSSCPDCHGNALVIEDLGEVPIVRCMECGTFMGVWGTRNVNRIAQAWNATAQIRAEHSRLAESIRTCPRLLREIKE